MCPSAVSGCRGNRRNATQNGGTIRYRSALTGDDTLTRRRTVNTANPDVELRTDRETSETSGITSQKKNRHNRTTNNQKDKRERKENGWQSALTGDGTPTRGQRIDIMILLPHSLLFPLPGNTELRINALSEVLS